MGDKTLPEPVGSAWGPIVELISPPGRSPGSTADAITDETTRVAYHVHVQGQ